MEKYPKYKQTNIEWIQEIPEGWELRRLGSLGNFKASGIDKKIVDGEPFVKMVNYTNIFGNDFLILNNQIEYMEVTCPIDRIDTCNVLKGDIIFTPSSETEDEIGLSAVSMEDLYNTVFSYHVIRFRAKENFDINFKKFLCNNIFVLSQFTRFSKGTTRKILVRDNFRNILVFIPPLPEQKAIAEYLDKKTDTINKLIDKQKKLIELLKEKRSAIITEAVTKGLNPNAKLKPSGVDWIGDIPESWEVRRLRTVIRFNPVKSELKVGNQDFSVQFLPMELIPEDSYKLELSKDALLSEVYNSYTFFRNGDVLVAKITPCFENGKGAIATDLINGIGFGTTEIHILRPRSEFIDCFFLYYLTKLHSFRSIGESNMKGSAGQKRVPELFIKDFVFPFPTVNEQQEIAEYIKSKTETIDKLIDKATQIIEKLGEYKQSIITEAVTGKVRVYNV